MSTELRDLVSLLYDADWTQLSLSATVHLERAPDADEEDDEDDEDDLGERQLLISPGGRYRVSAADGRLLTVCDGTSVWEIDGIRHRCPPQTAGPMRHSKGC
jgi:hypothetical protein